MVCALGACCGTTVLASETSDVIENDVDAALARAAREHRPVFVHFTASWCLPCKELKETVYRDPSVASRLARFVRAEVDVESQVGERFARRYDVQSVPVLVFLAADGREMRSLRTADAPAARELAAILDKALAEAGAAGDTNTPRLR